MDNTDEILKEADACVKCGLCLPHCPTYGVTASERESPRGRVALVQGLLQGDLSAEGAWPALDRCLGCAACERACPSGVRVTALVDAMRARTLARRTMPGRLLYRSSLRLLARPGIWIGAARAARWIGLGRLPGPGRWLRALPEAPPCARVTPRAGTLLFAGCTGRGLEPAALEAAVRVCAGLGIPLALPAGRLCCGALFRHQGLEGEGRRLLEESARVLSGYSRILTVASACAGGLQGHPALSGRVQEICTFLATRPGLEAPPLAGRVAVHTPCTQNQWPGGDGAALRLLARVPDLEVIPLDAGWGCCGAAGIQMLRHPGQARRLRAPLIQWLARHPVDWLATTNTGCALHLRAGLAEAGLAIPVVHPLELVAGRSRP